jgi:hypothetical protein
MIIHGKIMLPGDCGPVLFAQLMNVSCSICAPATMAQADVEAFACTAAGPAQMGGWVSVDKSKAGIGDPTPNPCNVYPERKHWFLFDAVNAAALFGEIIDK